MSAISLLLISYLLLCGAWRFSGARMGDATDCPADHCSMFRDCFNGTNVDTCWPGLCGEGVCNRPRICNCPRYFERLKACIEGGGYDLCDAICPDRNRKYAQEILKHVLIFPILSFPCLLAGVYEGERVYNSV